jgi:[protein-PII] uridylyltransferase
METLSSGFRLGRPEFAALRARLQLRQRALVDTGETPKVLISNDISDDFTVLDVTCRDQIGLLFQVSLVLSEMGVDVHGAVLSTEADKAIDSFYVTTDAGARIDDAAHRRAIVLAIERELGAP